MYPTTDLPTPSPTLRLRLQAPALTVISPSQHHASLPVTRTNSLTWQAQAGAVTLCGICQPVNDALWHLDFTLENHGGDVEVRVALPYLFYHFEQDQPARMFNPLFGGILDASTIPLRISYPGQASFCMTAAAELDCTLAMGVFDAEQRHVVIRHIPAGVDGQIRFVFERIWLKAGQTLALPTQFIALGEDWATAMRPYKEWFAVHFQRPRSRPAWWEQGNFSETRYAHCLAPVNPPEAAAGVWIFDNEGRPRTFEQVKGEIDEAVRQGRQQGFTPLFYQFGWWQNMADLRGLFMFDSLCGDYTEAHRLSKQVVEYIHQQGARTYFYTNAISAGDESETYQAHPELFARDGRGFPVYNMDYPMLMFCPGAPGMKAYWERILTYLLIDLGVDGLFLDQVCGGAPPVYCYDPAHHHDHPDTYGKDFLDLIHFIGQRARQIKSDCYIGGELVQDTRGILLDEVHGYGYSRPPEKAPAAVEKQRTGPAQEYYVFTRYLCPEIYSAIGHSPTGLMNGAAGHHADTLWRQYRSVFESTVTPCKVDAAGALAYLYGPVNGTAILAVRAQGEIGKIEIQLKPGLKLLSPYPEGLTEITPGRLTCQAGKEPAFYPLTFERGEIGQ